MNNAIEKFGSFGVKDLDAMYFGLGIGSQDILMPLLEVFWRQIERQWIHFAQSEIWKKEGFSDIKTVFIDTEYHYILVLEGKIMQICPRKNWISVVTSDRKRCLQEILIKASSEENVEIIYRKIKLFIEKIVNVQGLSKYISMASNYLKDECVSAGVSITPEMRKFYDL